VPSQGAKTEIKINIKRKIAPKRTEPLARMRCQADCWGRTDAASTESFVESSCDMLVFLLGLVTNSWIEKDVGEIHQQIHQNIDQRKKQNDALNGWKVSGKYSVDR